MQHSPECSSYSASLQQEPNLESRALNVGCRGEFELMFDDFIPGDPESPHAAPEGVVMMPTWATMTRLLASLLYCPHVAPTPGMPLS